MEDWRKVWRLGFGPLMSRAGLEALALALEYDDPRLIQTGTTRPPPLQCMQDQIVEAACAVGYGGWADFGIGEPEATVGEVEEFFARACYACDQALGEPAACRHFLNWFDETPRDLVLRFLLPEVRRSLSLLPAEEDTP